MIKIENSTLLSQIVNKVQITRQRWVIVKCLHVIRNDDDMKMYDFESNIPIQLVREQDCESGNLEITTTSGIKLCIKIANLKYGDCRLTEDDLSVFNDKFKQ